MNFKQFWNKVIHNTEEEIPLSIYYSAYDEYYQFYLVFLNEQKSTKEKIFLNEGYFVNWYTPQRQASNNEKDALRGYLIKDKNEALEWVKERVDYIESNYHVKMELRNYS